MNLNNRIVLLGAVVMLAVASVARAAGENQGDPNLPPEGVYLSPTDVHAMYTGQNLTVVLSAIQHRPFRDGNAGVPGPTHTPDGADDLEGFASSITGDVSINGSPNQPISGGGPVQVRVLNYTPGQTGTFQTEMLSMDLTAGPALIRESPSRPSLGQVRITNIGGGMYHIDSFFDIFTELSMDGGQTWMPSVDGGGAPASTHVDLVPEPSTVTLLGVGLAGLLGYVWRRRRSVS